MICEIQTKFSLAFNRRAITTHQFQKNGSLDIVSDYWGKYLYSIPTLSKTWAEATPVDKNHYAIMQKQHDTHRRFYGEDYIAGGSKFYQNGVAASFNGQEKTIFSYDEAISVLKNLEKGYEKEGYAASAKQPFKNRIYTQEKASAPKAA